MSDIVLNVIIIEEGGLVFAVPVEKEEGERRKENASDKEAAASHATSNSLLLSPFSSTRLYVAACKQERIDRILPVIRHLGIEDWIIERERPGNPDDYGRVVLDPASRRFIGQLTVNVERPFMWLEDDADVRPDFQERVAPFLETLPSDWKIAVLGWGLIFEDIEYLPINEHWCQVQGGQNWGAFAGAQCMLVNSGAWRENLAKHRFRCDVGLPGAMRAAGIAGQRNGLYLSRTILVGTNDPNTTFDKPVITYPVYSQPKRFSWKRHEETGDGYSEMEEE